MRSDTVYNKLSTDVDTAGSIDRTLSSKGIDMEEATKDWTWGTPVLRGWGNEANTEKRLKNNGQ